MRYAIKDAKGNIINTIVTWSETELAPLVPMGADA